MLIQGFIWASLVFFATALNVVVDERARAWTLLTWLAPSKEIIAGLYPYISGIEEIEEGVSFSEHLVNKIAEVDENLASMFEITYEHYPMGVLDELAMDYAGVGNNVVVLNGINYTEPDQVFYFKTDELQKQAAVEDLRLLRENDIVIGDAYGADGKPIPLVLFYGCPGSEQFDEFSRSLYGEATESNKLRFVWRSTCAPKEALDYNPYPVGVTVRSFPEDADALLNSGIALDLPEGMEEVDSEDLAQLEVEDFEKLDLKLITLLSDYFKKNGRDFKKFLNYSKRTINNLPLLVPQILKTEEDGQEITESNSFLKEINIDHKMLGIYVNGQFVKYPLAHMSTLLNVIRTELQYVNGIAEIMKSQFKTVSAATVKNLMRFYSVFSISNLNVMQPYKIDTHRIIGYSESIIYFNDIEEDPEYSLLSNDISVFFEESKFGELPELRQNWNEIVFVIDVDNLATDMESKNALASMLRTVQVVENGYPQRIGFIPFSKSGNSKIVRKIYELKEFEKPSEIVLYLTDLLENDGKGSGSRFKNLPDYKNVLKELSINETSIIINGDVFRFKGNTWNYLLALTIKRDVQLVKDELTKMGKYSNDLDIRELLHTKSLPKRNTKFTTDYFEEATYTRVNNSVLDFFKDRILEQEKKTGHNILHTITLVDDFNTEVAIKRLNVISKNKFSGVKLRIIHTGDISKKSCWEGFMKKGTKIDLSKLSVGRCSTIPEKDKNVNTYLSSWLLDIPSHDLDGTPMLIVNGRVVFFNDDYVPETSDIDAYLSQESKRTLDLVYILEEMFTGFSSEAIDPVFMESISSYMTKLFYHSSDPSEGSLYYSTETSLARMDLGNLDKVNGITMFKLHEKEDFPIDIHLVLDPIEERSQKLISLVERFVDLPFVNIHLTWFSTEKVTFTPNNRVYLDDLEEMKSLTSSELDYEVDMPWFVSAQSDDQTEKFMFRVHVYPATDRVQLGNVEGQANVCIQMRDSKGNIVDRSITMSTYGYAQLGISDLSESYTIESCDHRYKVESFSVNPKAEYIPTEKIHWKTNLQEMIYVKVTPTGLPAEQDYETETINLFTTLMNKEDEEKFKTTVLNTIITTGGRPVTFYVWYEPTISQGFREFAKIISSSVKGKSVSIQFVGYKWPSWIRPQRFRERRLAVSKLLFLDLIFPSTVEKLLIVPPELKNVDIVDIYDSEIKRMFAMAKMGGTGYWSEGYWAEKLSKQKLEFHSTLPFIFVNMKQLRVAYGGDYLRIHYQMVSTDINSLQVIDQDLLNDLQTEIPIRTLRKTSIKKVRVNQVKLKKLEAKVQELTKTFVNDQENNYFEDEL
ncbi:Kre5p [Nakaseomyces bracarensis]|uniref:Kre5p n=1 Tax=Nakaseomyces bracarensis TaxID=273131 RepID=UPI003871E4FC